MDVVEAAQEWVHAGQRTALAAFGRVHPIGHRRCSERCHAARLDLQRAIADLSRAYGAMIFGESR